MSWLMGAQYATRDNDNYHCDNAQAKCAARWRRPAAKGRTAGTYNFCLPRARLHGPVVDVSVRLRPEKIAPMSLALQAWRRRQLRHMNCSAVGCLVSKPCGVAALAARFRQNRPPGDCIIKRPRARARCPAGLSCDLWRRVNRRRKQAPLCKPRPSCDYRREERFTRAFGAGSDYVVCEGWFWWADEQQ